MKKSNKVIIVVTSLFLITLVLGIGSPMTAGAQTKPIVMRIAHVMPTGHAYQIWANKFKEELAKRVGDRIDVQIFPSGQLGTETEYLEGMRMGTIDGCIAGRYGQIDIRLDSINLPFIWKDYAQSDHVLRSSSPSKLQQTFDKILYEKGYMCLGWGDNGYRYITTKDKPIRKADDLKGLDIRVPNVPVWIPAFKAWGANPTPLDFSEVYSALQQGVVKAQENPPEIIFNSKFYEVQKYLSLTAHAYMPNQFLLGVRYWEKLPKDLQKAVLEAAIAGRDYHVKLSREANDKLVAELGRLGMTVIRDVDRKSFIPGAEVAYKQFEGRIGKDIIDAIRNAE